MSSTKPDMKMKKVRIIWLRPGMKLPATGVMKQLGPVATGLLKLAHWKLPTWPGALVVGGGPSLEQLQTIVAKLREQARLAGQGVRIEADRLMGESSGFGRHRIGRQPVMLTGDDVGAMQQALERLAKDQEPFRGRQLMPAQAEKAEAHFILQAKPEHTNQAGDGAGVGFTRNPATGENRLAVRFLEGGRGREAVSSVAAVGYEGLTQGVKKQLEQIKAQLEQHNGVVLEIEFGVVAGKVVLSKLEPARLSAQAAVTSTVALAQARIITHGQALARVDPTLLTELIYPGFEPTARSSARVLTKGFAASPGVAVGKLVFSSGEAMRRGGAGEAVILVQAETYARDVAGMQRCKGVLTSSGGMTSHAALVARGWGLCAVVGAGDVHIDPRKKRVVIGGKVFTERDVISLDGSTGEVLEGELQVSAPKLDGQVQPLLTWADKVRRLKVLANADTPEDASKAWDMGAQGIGLCRTEHMFFAGDRLRLVQRMILVEEQHEHDGEQVFTQLESMQQSDFEKILTRMEGRPVTVRLLDAPLHEFLPGEQDKQAQSELAQALGISKAKLRERLQGLRECNPMMGWRGCRLGLMKPAVLTMQVRAILGAVRVCMSRGMKVDVGVMFPLVSTEEELSALVGRVRELEMAQGEPLQQTGPQATGNQSSRVPRMRLGVMIETPRAALLAGKLARYVDFLSLGTNDLTQLTYGISRDDAGLFLPAFLEHRWMIHDPFMQLDFEGVGWLVREVVRQARRTNPQIVISLCGEHGGDPASIVFAHEAGLDSVSCSAMRIPVARLAAGRAALK